MYIKNRVLYLKIYELQLYMDIIYLKMKLVSVKEISYIIGNAMLAYCIILMPIFVSTRMS